MNNRIIVNKLGLFRNRALSAPIVLWMETGNKYITNELAKHHVSFQEADCLKKTLLLYNILCYHVDLMDQENSPL